MNIVIPDDYQDIINQLDCFSLIARHNVTRYQKPAGSEDEMVERYRNADVIVAVRERTELTRSVIERLPNLKLVALVGRTTRKIDYAACTERGIPITTGKSNSPSSPAELTVALILASRRHIALEAAAMKRGDWPSTLSHRLSGSTLGIFGLGAIGALVAEAGRGLGMEVLVWGREGSLERADAAGFAVAGGQDHLFETSDVLSLHVRLNRETHGIVGPSDLARMKPAALLVNTSRAELIEPGALVSALLAGRPGFAAVDVYEEEPIEDGNHPLLALPNALCVPHLGWSEWDNFELYFTEAFEQIAAYEKGEPLRLANPEVLERG
jgi:D-3-phosphoglycerate dehydrogenase